MAGRMRQWTAKWRTTGTRMVPGGKYVVAITVRVSDPEGQAGREIVVELTPDLAASLALSLDSLAQEAERYNAKQAIGKQMHG